MDPVATADCLNWLASLPEGGAALAFADPPYNLAIDYGEGSPADDRDPGEYVAWCGRWMRGCFRALRPGGWLYVVISPHFAPEVGVEINRAGFTRRNQVVWREAFGNYKQSCWSPEHRVVYHGVRPPWKARTWNPDAVRVPSARQKKYGDKRADARGRVPGDVWDFPRVCGTFKERVKGVPTQLPQALLRRVLLACTNQGDRVVEPFAGSGSLGATCKELGRHYSGCDVNPRYAGVANARIREARGPA